MVVFFGSEVAVKFSTLACSGIPSLDIFLLLPAELTVGSHERTTLDHLFPLSLEHPYDWLSLIDSLSTQEQSF